MIRPPGTVYKRWTHEEEQRLRDLVKLGKTREEIVVLLGRNYAAVTGKVYQLCLHKRCVALNSMTGRPQRKPNPENPGLGAPAEVLAERAARLSVHFSRLSPSQLLLGDPLPGRSALDQRNANVGL